MKRPEVAAKLEAVIEHATAAQDLIEQIQDNVSAEPGSNPRQRLAEAHRFLTAVDAQLTPLIRALRNPDWDGVDDFLAGWDV